MNQIYSHDKVRNGQSVSLGAYTLHERLFNLDMEPTIYDGYLVCIDITWKSTGINKHYKARDLGYGIFEIRFDKAVHYFYCNVSEGKRSLKAKHKFFYIGDHNDPQIQQLFGMEGIKSRSELSFSIEDIENINAGEC